MTGVQTCALPIFVFEVSPDSHVVAGVYTAYACVTAAAKPVVFPKMLFRSFSPAGRGDGNSHAAERLAAEDDASFPPSRTEL